MGIRITTSDLAAAESRGVTFTDAVGRMESQLQSELDKAVAELRQLRAEVRSYQASCEEHIEARNREGEERGILRRRLIELSSYAATARDTNQPEWMEGLVEHLNNAAIALNEPTQFVLRKRRADLMVDSAMWITAETIP